MSWQAIAWAVKQDTGSPAGKMLLLVLADHANKEGVCWPSQYTLAKLTKMSRRSVCRHIRLLEKAKLVKASQRPRERGQWPLLTYQLPVPTVSKIGTRSAPSPCAKSDTHREPNWHTNLKKENLKKEEAVEMSEGKQAVFPTYSPQWHAWLEHYEATGNLRRADLMRHQAENGRWGTWAEPTPYPPPYPVAAKKADNR